MAFQRKYKFNWLDHLHYMGNDVVVWSVWFYFELFFVGVPLLLLLLCVGVMVIKQTVNASLIYISIYAACTIAIVFNSKRWLKIHRFTPQRECAYFRCYPQRKYYRTPFIITIGAYLMTSMLGGFLIYYILQWADKSVI